MVEINFNRIFQLLHSNIAEEIESSLLVNNQIHIYIAIIQGPTISKWVFYAWIDLKQNIVPDEF